MSHRDRHFSGSTLERSCSRLCRSKSRQLNFSVFLVYFSNVTNVKREVIEGLYTNLVGEVCDSLSLEIVSEDVNVSLVLCFCEFYNFHLGFSLV